MALADLDGDGDLDLYVCNFRPTTILDQPGAKFTVRNLNGRPVVIGVNGRPVTEPDLADRFEVSPGGTVLEYGEADVLWINDGAGRFTAANWTDGTFLDEDGRALTAPFRDWGLAAHLADVNNDGRPDLYVCNDLHTPDRFWLNVSTNGRAQLQAISRTALRNNSTFSMGVDFGDLNRDGFVDLFTVDMLARDRAARARQLAGLSPHFWLPGQFEDREQVLRNALQLNRGDTTFAETGIYSGVEASDWSWGPIFLDVDLDGFEDILITNGQLRDFQDSDSAERIAAAQRGGRVLSTEDVARLTLEVPKFDTPNALFRNLTRERFQATSSVPVVPVFADYSTNWGFATFGISQGAALADLDGDGDLDVVMNNLNDAPGIFRNDGVAPRVAVRLHGAGRNTRGVGAKLTLRTAQGGHGFPIEQGQHVIAGSRYLSGDEGLRVFATGEATNVAVEVRWPSGRVSLATNIGPNSVLEVREAAASPLSRPATSTPLARLRFVNVSERLNHRHTEEAFDELSRQPLLPNKLSQLGPGAAWADFDGDGRDDLIVGSGRSGSLAIWDNDGRGNFRRRDEPLLNRPVARDLTTILPVGATLLVGSSNWEDGQTNGGALRVYDLTQQRSGEAILGVSFSVGPLAAADLDGDGELEIFVGGRAQPGRWPEPAPSFLLNNTSGRLTVVKRFDGLGRISGACFTDFDGDGDPDLALAGEWGPIRLMRNDAGNLVEFDPPVSLPSEQIPLSRLSGLWNSITSGDFDGDGRLDLVAGNWGLNSRLTGELPPNQRPSIATSLPPTTLRRIYYGEVSGTGGLDIIESLPEDGTEWPGKELMVWSMAFPWMRPEVPTYAAFSRSTLAQVFGKRLESLRTIGVNWLASTVFLNRGGSYEARPLPDFAQLSPVFGLAVTDADGNGTEDVFLAQNWFAADPLTSRSDAGRGLWLLGNGRGEFSVELLSGVAAYGEQRAAAVADFDADGRSDLVVTQNGTATQLYRNVGAKPGLRVRLQGPAGNPAAIGACVRIVGSGLPGPWRELHLGSGYWSTDSATVVLAWRNPRSESDFLEVRWPGGKLTRTALTAEVTEVAVRPDGTLSPRANPK
ncbi:MAG TPA: hypothetical protein DCE44_19110 [Verrucomicrobiales bacterium]|nr:hypothetical protein [Verrucomicrobiales bacterium]